MGLHKSIRDVFVINNPALLTSGDSTNLAVGQLGIFGYDPNKDRLATGSPNFSSNKAIQLIVGTPDVPTNLLGAVANQSKVSKPIKGRKITSWEGRAAKRGQTQKITIGYDGFDTTKTLFAKCEESKTVFLKLSGGPIDQVFHTEGKGLVRQYSVYSGCCDDCGNDCAQVSAEAMADDLISQINADPILSLGSRTGNKLVVAKKVIGAAAPTPASTINQYTLAVCDNGDDVSLGAVQAQYPTFAVTRIGRSGSTSTYQLFAASLPTAFNDSGIPVISDCPVCPSGYTLTTGLYAAVVTRQDNGTTGATATLESDYSISGSGQTAVRLIYQFGQSTYLITTVSQKTAVGTDSINQLGLTRNTCVLTSPSTIAWVVGSVYNIFDQTYTITLEDTVCGTSRLAELQAAYPDLVITDNGAGTGTLCVHNFSTVVPSAPIAPGCPPDAPVYVAPDAFKGIAWTVVPPTYGSYAVGVEVESAFVDLQTNECAYKFWNYDAEPIFIEISQHSQDYNDTPTLCAGDWAVTEIQAASIPIGVGSQVRDVEIYFKGYERKFWDINPIVRQYQDALVQADPTKYYDQYTIGFDFDYHEFWFSEKMTDSYRVEVYFPEGTGGQFQNAINAYVASVGIDLEPVAIV